MIKNFERFLLIAVVIHTFRDWGWFGGPGVILGAMGIAWLIHYTADEPRSEQQQDKAK